MAEFFTRCAEPLSNEQYDEYAREAFSHLLWALYGPPALQYLLLHQHFGTELTEVENTS